jgi:hypothetical protein
VHAELGDVGVEATTHAEEAGASGAASAGDQKRRGAARGVGTRPGEESRAARCGEVEGDEVTREVEEGW